MKPVIEAISTAFCTLIYTKKRIKKENKLKAIHTRTTTIDDNFKKS